MGVCGGCLRGLKRVQLGRGNSKALARVGGAEENVSLDLADALYVLNANLPASHTPPSDDALTFPVVETEGVVDGEGMWWTLGSASHSSEASLIDIPEVPDEGLSMGQAQTHPPGIGVVDSVAACSASVESSFPCAGAGKMLDRLPVQPFTAAPCFRRARSMMEGARAVDRAQESSFGPPVSRLTHTLGTMHRPRIAPLSVSAAVQTSMKPLACPQRLSSGTPAQPTSAPRTVPPRVLPRNGRQAPNTNGMRRLESLSTTHPVFPAGARVLYRVAADEWSHTTVLAESPTGHVTVGVAPEPWLSVHDQKLLLRPAASVYDVGDPVHYCRRGGLDWVSTMVLCVSATGHLQVEDHPGFWLSPGEQWHAVRPHPSRERFSAGDEVAYYSTTHSRWQEACVLDVRPNGAIEVDSKPGFWLSLTHQASRVRKRPSGFGA